MQHFDDACNHKYPTIVVATTISVVRGVVDSIDYCKAALTSMSIMFLQQPLDFQPNFLAVGFCFSLYFILVFPLFAFALVAVY